MLRFRMTATTPALWSVFRFVGHHFPAVAMLAGVAAFGRFYQTGSSLAEGAIVSFALGALVGLSRVLLAVLVIGDGSVPAGVRALRRFLSLPPEQKNRQVEACTRRIKEEWRSLVIEIVAFVVLAIGLNLAIAAMARSDPAAEWAARLGVDKDAALPVQLLLKNLSTIPLTIIFQLRLAARVWAPSTHATGR